MKKGNEIISFDESINVSVPNRTNLPYRILIVDDDSNFLQFGVDLLADSGYDVDVAKDGAAGWEALQANSYDLIITDNQMPKMTGIEMIEKMRSASMTLPVIMTTGYLSTRELARKPWLKPEVTLEKPFSNDNLLEAIKRVLRMEEDKGRRKETLLQKYL